MCPQVGREVCTAAYRKDRIQRGKSLMTSVPWFDPNSDFCNNEPAVRADGFLHQKIPEEFILRVSLSC